MPTDPNTIALRCRLAEWCHLDCERVDFVYANGWAPYVHNRVWRPDESRDDCEPLLREVERRNLEEKFCSLVACDGLVAADHAEAFHTGLWCGLMFTPAQIVAAVEKLMEKTDAD